MIVSATLPRAARGADLGRLIRGALFLAAFLLFWITIEPFNDLTDPTSVGPSEGSNGLYQAAILALTLAMTAFLLQNDPRRLHVIVTPLVVVMLAWMALSVMASPNLDISARRFILTLLVIVIVAGALQLPQDVRHFSNLLAAGTLIVLATAYAGVIFLPHLSIHGMAEVLEPQHAGSWRGHFAHKNIAGAAMVLAIFVGLFVARVSSVALGSAIVLLATVFLLFTGAKTSTGLAALTLATAWIVTTLRSQGLRAVLVVGSVAFFLLFTVGSVLIAPVRAVLEAVASDPTFTSRDDVWRFALGQLWERPLVGYGFQAFWRTSAMFYSGAESWAATTTDAHNGYVELAVTIGLPGLALVMLWIIGQPLRDLGRSEETDNDRTVATLFVRIWLFGLYFACLEGPFFGGRGPIWFMILLAVLGLRCHATLRAVTEERNLR
jgi:O-antigen ligase